MVYKLKSCFLFVFMLSTTIACIAQVSIQGRIQNELNEVLPYATINIEGSQCGTLSDENGYFELSCSVEESKASVIVFRHLGYVSKSIRVDEYKKSKDITLSFDALVLDEIVFVAGKSSSKKEVQFEYDLKRPDYHYQKDIKSTYQLASYIDNSSYASGYLKEIIFHIGQAASDKVPIRLNFYNVDANCNCPSKALHATSIIVNVRRGKNRINLEDYNVHVDGDDFYVAFEWLSVADKARRKLDFSIGMIPFESDFPMLEKLGGLKWRKLERGSKSRVWTKIKLVRDE